MKSSVVLIFILLFTRFLHSQQNEISFNGYSVFLTEKTLAAVTPDGQNLFELTFRSPVLNVQDLDNDGLTEIFLTDSYTENGMALFTIYIFNTLDNFFLADSINSGTIEPYITISEDIGESIIVTGNSAFLPLISEIEESVLPVDCWKFESGELFLVNDEVYDIFINENDVILNYISGFYEAHGSGCSSSRKLTAALAACYLNYINAGELSVASQLFKNYYFCEDGDVLKQRITDLIKKDEQ